MANFNTKQHLCRSWGSWVMLQKVSTRKFVIKRPLRHGSNVN